ncbi:hypothetical protein K0504_15990 [Neiella marina]|uniref:DUF5666 domain-containing protein n=1 Tax=Neiella holothuriorum TaxID=2870530 RepID=A0ABS7EJN0_9GAMM|nr:hypothetical protein [Neiella holothuriorum]MBW8192541.1 hypothetical protein [Neiella holothuriorum]
MLTKARNLVLAGAIAFISFSATSASITLKDGRVIEGEVVSQQGDNLIVNSGGIEVTLPKAQVANIDLTGGSAPAPQAAAPAPQAAAPAPQAAAPQASSQPAVVNAGTPFTVRTTQKLSTRGNGQGQRFTGVLEADMVAANGSVIAPRGTQVYGRITSSQSSGRMTGTAGMSLEITEIMINNQMKAVVTNTLNASSGQNETGKTLGRTARTAAIGGLIDGSSGAKTGAKVGLGASILTRGNDVEIPNGTLLDFQLRAPFQGL